MRLAILALSLFAFSAAASPAPREGWSVIETDMPYQTLINRVKEAANANGMGVVTEAGPTQQGASRSRATG